MIVALIGILRTWPWWVGAMVGNHMGFMLGMVVWALLENRK